MSDMTNSPEQPDSAQLDQFDTKLSLRDLIQSRLFYLVAIPGALGGTIGWLMGLGFEAETFTGEFWNWLIAVILGAVSGFVLVVVLTNTNRSDMLRLVTLSFLAGWVHQPILEQGVEAIGGGSIRDLVNIENATVIEFGNFLSQGKSVREQLDSEDIISRVEEISAGLENLSLRESEIVLQILALQVQTLDEQDQRYLLDIYASVDLDVEEYVAEPEQAEVLYEDIQEIGESVDFLLMNNETTVFVDDVTEAWITLEVPFYANEDVHKRIFVNSEVQDLVAVLYNEDGTQIGFGDDYEGSTNPQIDELMKTGQNYFLQVTEYYGEDLENFSVVFLEEHSDQLLNTSNTDALLASVEPGTRAQYSADGDQAYWIDFILGEQRAIVIDFIAAESSTNDLVTQLYNKNTGDFIGEYDDREISVDTNPRVSVTLEPGQYSFRVSDYYEEGVLDFEIIVRDPELDVF